MTKHAEVGDAVYQIVKLNKELTAFWGDAEGWASIKSADLLSRSRLDRQVSLSESLYHWIDVKDISDGDLILAWVNLGSLVEGTMMLFLSVYYDDYKNDLNDSGVLTEPDYLTLDKLKTYFNKQQILKHRKVFMEFIELVQKRRNAIHSFRNRDIGNHLEFYKAVSDYCEFIQYVRSMLPYPDDTISYGQWHYE